MALDVTLCTDRIDVGPHFPQCRVIFVLNNILSTPISLQSIAVDCNGIGHALRCVLIALICSFLAAKVAAPFLQGSGRRFLLHFLSVI
jgi:hypothetical protein